MSWVIFWTIIILYWTVGIKRMPVYFHRIDRANYDRYPNIYEEASSHKESAWGALGLAAFWPYYEGGRWVRDHIINTMTAEQRRQKEYEKAEKIVAEYTQRKEQEERDAFDRELKSGN